MPSDPLGASSTSIPQALLHGCALLLRSATVPVRSGQPLAQLDPSDRTTWLCRACRSSDVKGGHIRICAGEFSPGYMSRSLKWEDASGYRSAPISDSARMEP